MQYPRDTFTTLGTAGTPARHSLAVPRTAGPAPPAYWRCPLPSAATAPTYRIHPWRRGQPTGRRPVWCHRFWPAAFGRARAAACSGSRPCCPATRRFPARTLSCCTVPAPTPARGAPHTASIRSAGTVHHRPRAGHSTPSASALGGWSGLPAVHSRRSKGSQVRCALTDSESASCHVTFDPQPSGLLLRLLREYVLEGTSRGAQHVVDGRALHGGLVRPARSAGGRSRPRAGAAPGPTGDPPGAGAGPAPCSRRCAGCRGHRSGREGLAGDAVPWVRGSTPQHRFAQAGGMPRRTGGRAAIAARAPRVRPRPPSTPRSYACSSASWCATDPGMASPPSSWPFS